jgi:hypothetical protein
MSAKKLPPMIFDDKFLEHNRIAWRIEQAQQDSNNPLLEPKYPWDSACPSEGHGTVLRDPIDGLFKAWQVSESENLSPKSPMKDFGEQILTYAYSQDGVNWIRPELDICPRPGYPKTNIIFDLDSGGIAKYASVFVDPKENPDEPYEMFIFREPYCRGTKLYVDGFDQKPAKDRTDSLKYGGLYRYRSKDGLHWRGVEGPIKLESGDTLYVYKDKENQGYVAHHKMGGIPPIPEQIGGYIPYDIGVGQGIRIVQRRTSKDGTNWSHTIPILMPDWRDNPGDQIMELGYHPYGQGVIGVVSLYHAMTQRMELQFAASLDGIKWWRPIPRQACLPNGSLGDYGGGLIWPTKNLIEDDGRLYFYYGAMSGLHGDIYAKERSDYLFHGAFCRAGWEVGRMWAAINADAGLSPGYLTTQKLVNAKGKKLIINAVTKSGGKIEAELLNSKLKPIPGFTRKDCLGFQGDEKFATVAWKDKATCPRNDIHLRIWISKSYLYGFEWR